MQFNEAELLAIQYPRSEHYGISATYSASLTMGNCAKIHAKIDALRRVDGTVTAADVKSVYLSENVKLDEWAHGEVVFSQIADDFNEGREPESIPDVIRDSLTTMTVIGNSAKLSAQLERADYAKVNKILEALGGKWNKKAGAHLFAGCDPEEVIANYLETGKLDKPEKFGFFPTPAPLARELVKLAGLQPGHTVLEPEAGVAGIANICAEVTGKGNVVCYEIQQKNCDVLRGLGFKVEQADFLTVEPTQQFDRVILNPPFEKQADIDHVKHAFRFLKPGGTLAAIARPRSSAPSSIRWGLRSARTTRTPSRKAAPRRKPCRSSFRNPTTGPLKRQRASRSLGHPQPLCWCWTTIWKP
jgi:hypothetical protein